MARMNLLTPVKVRSLTKPGTFGDGGGLYLQVRGPTQRSWVFRYKIARKARLMGLGAYPDIGLAEAREAAGEARKALRIGIDPLEQRRAARVEAAARAGLNTFSEIADAYMKSHESSWRSPKHRDQWCSSLTAYVYPVIGKLSVAAIATGDVMRVLEPMWLATPETATRVRGRIELVLDYATARGWRSGENPARWRGHLAHTLPAREKIARVQHHAALPWKQIGAFMADLSKQLGVAARALEFVILTAARSGEAMGARWSEIDMSAAVWTIPPERMKAAQLHRVPLPDAAVAVLHEAAKLRQGDGGGALVFPGTRGSTLSNNALSRLLRQMDRGDLTVHGFRSTFRDWCAEATNHPREIAEKALAHTLHDKTEAAYQRGDLLEKRRKLMSHWAEHCSRPMAATGGAVVPIRSAG
jgi:integrase